MVHAIATLCLLVNVGVDDALGGSMKLSWNSKDWLTLIMGLLDLFKKEKK